MSVAESCDIVLVAAEVLFFCGPVAVRFVIAQRLRSVLDFEGAELLVDHLPDYLI